MAINLSGSLILTGSITTTGGITISGSIASASFAGDTALFAGKPVTVFPTTGSNTFVGSQTITGSVLQSGSLSVNGCIVSTGQIVAQTINVQQVTSSIVYSCGSNIFGTALNNTQTICGNIFATGSVACFASTVCSNRVSTTDGTNVSTLENNFLRSTAGNFYFDTCAVGASFNFRTSNASALDSTAMFICGTNSRVGIGTTVLCSNGLSIRSTSDDYSLAILQQNTNTAGYGFFAGNSGDFSIARLSGGVYSSAALKIQLNTNVVCFSNTVCVGGTLVVNGNTINVNCDNTTATDARINLYTRNSVNGDRASIYTYNLSATTAGCELTYLAFGYCCTNNQGYINMQTKSGGAWCNTMNIINGSVGIGTTSPSYKLDISTAQSIRVVGSSTGYTQGSIIFQSSTLDTPEARGLGVYAFNEGTDATWFYGTAYNAADTFVVNRKAGTTYQDAAASVGEASTFLSINNTGRVGLNTTNVSTEANLFLGAQGTVEGGQLVLQKGTSCSCATHLDNYQDSFRVLVGTDTSSNGVHMVIDHKTRNACFYGVISTSSGVKFGGGSSTLNYYEEGTFTPYFCSAGLSGITYGSGQTGYYTRVGRLVFISINIMTEALTSSGTNNAVTIRCLPFTSANVSEGVVGLVITDNSRYSSTPPINASIGQNASFVYLYTTLGSTGPGTDPTPLYNQSFSNGAGNRNITRLSGVYITS